jgi:hypothetical protein
MQSARVNPFRLGGSVMRLVTLLPMWYDERRRTRVISCRFYN